MCFAREYVMLLQCAEPFQCVTMSKPLFSCSSDQLCNSETWITWWVNYKERILEDVFFPQTQAEKNSFPGSLYWQVDIRWSIISTGGGALGRPCLTICQLLLLMPFLFSLCDHRTQSSWVQRQQTPQRQSCLQCWLSFSQCPMVSSVGNFSSSQREILKHTSHFFLAFLPVLKSQKLFFKQNTCHTWRSICFH